MTSTVPHIQVDQEGRAWIDDSNVKVVEVVLDHLAYGWGAEEMRRQHPHLSLAQIHAALAFYYDHKAEFDRQVEESLQRADLMASQSSKPKLQNWQKHRLKKWRESQLQRLHAGGSL